MELWDMLTVLWTAAVNFMGYEINCFGLNFTLWQFALGVAVLDILCWAVSRVLQ